jgi:hypothetical protein
MPHGGPMIVTPDLWTVDHDAGSPPPGGEERAVVRVDRDVSE